MLDTHALVWLYLDPERIRTKVRDELADRANAVLVSAVSGYEVSLKHRLGKMPQAGPLLNDFQPWAAELRFEFLDVSLAPALAAGSLNWTRKDPFDRLLVAQALVDDLTLVSNEKSFGQTGVRLLW